MRIAYLAAGAGGMYCGSCLHDNTLAAALLKRGEDVILAPIYTPIRTRQFALTKPTSASRGSSSAESTPTCNRRFRCSAIRRDGWTDGSTTLPCSDW
jgi:hypothetical protein